MKRQITLLFVIFFTSLIYAQNPIQWVVYKGGSSNENISDLFITDSTYVIAASSKSNNFDVPMNHGLDDIWFFSTSKSNGNIGFNKVFGAQAQDLGGKISLINSSFYISGTTNSNEGIFTNNHGYFDDYSIKTSLNGDLLLVSLFGGSKSESSGANINSKNQFVRTPRTTSYDGDLNCAPTINSRPWIYISDTLGNIVSNICIDSLTHMHGSPTFYSKNHYYIFSSGYLTANKGHTYTDTNGFYSNDFLALKYDTNFNLIKYRHYGSHKDQTIKKAIQTNDGGFMLFGETSYDGLDTLDVHNGHCNNSNYGIDLYCVRIDSNLNVEWTKCLGTTKSNMAYDIVQSNDGGFLVLGQILEVSGDVSYKANSNTIGDLWLVKLSPTGSIEWDRSYGGASDTENQPLVRQDTDGSIVLAGISSATDGTFTGLSNHGDDIFIIKLAPWVGIENKADSKHRFIVYPNPVKSQGFLYFGTHSKQMQSCTIRIFDMQGRKILTKEMPIVSKIALQLPPLSKGMYIYQISTKNHSNENGRFIVQ